MANTKKKVDVESTAADATIDETAALKAKIAEQEKQMADLMAQMKLMMQAQVGAGVVEQKPKKSTRSIKFINLVAGGLTLRGNRLYHIDTQFGYKMIPAGEARAIVNNMPNTIANGMVYIADDDFIAECELDGVYQDLLSDKQMKELLKKSADDVCAIYKNAPDAQKQIIVDMVANRKMEGLPIDANIVVALGKLCGKDLMAIEPEDDENEKE